MKKQNGITLIALVVTIIVLLILAGVSISMVAGDNGIATKATDAAEKTNIENVKEKILLAVANARLNNNGTMSEAELNEILDDYGTVEVVDGKSILVTTDKNLEIDITTIVESVDSEELVFYMVFDGYNITKTYTMTEGITWEEWIADSKLNVDGWTIKDADNNAVGLTNYYEYAWFEGDGFDSGDFGLHRPITAGVTYTCVEGTNDT